MKSFLFILVTIALVTSCFQSHAQNNDTVSILKDSIMNDSLSQQQQGTWVECVYCTMVDTTIGAACPYCKGEVNYFHPARMMDKETSMVEMMNKMVQLMQSYEKIFDPALTDKENIKLRDQWVWFLQQMQIYNFNLEEAVIMVIQTIDQPKDNQ